MAIVINSQPGDYRLTRDPLVFRVTGDQYVITPGVKHQFEFVFTTEPAIDDTLTIESAFIAPGTGKTFTFVNAVPGYIFDGVNLRIRLSSVTLENWIDGSFIPGLMADPDIAENYEIIRVGTSVIITAIDFGPDYNLTDLTATGFAIGGPGAVAGVLPVYRADYFIRARVNLETQHESGIYDRSVWFYFRPDETGQINADLSPKLDELFDWTPMLAATSGNVRRTSELRRFYVEWQELHIDGESAVVRSARRFCMKGSSRGWMNTAAILPNYTGSTSNFIVPPGNTALTERVVTRADRHHWFVVGRWQFAAVLGAGPIRPRFTVFYDDGTSQVLLGAALSGFAIDQLWAIQCGFIANALQNLAPALVPYAYQVELIDDAFGTPVTSALRFVLRQSSSIGIGDWRVIRFINRFGVAQTKPVFGAQVEECNPSRESMKRSRTLPLLANEADEFSHSITESTRLILPSGAFSDWDAEDILDLTMSPMHEVSIGTYEQASFVPATILNKADVLRSFDNTGGSYRAISIEFKLNTRR